MIIEQILVTDFAVFCYLIADEKSGNGILVDPAGDFDRIFQIIEKHRIKIKYIVNTHGHFDHTQGNEYIIQKTGARLLMHKDDVPMLGNLTGRMSSSFPGSSKSPKPIGHLEDGDIIKLGSIQIRVIHTPGHSRGSISLYVDGNLFTGDTLFTEGMGRTDLDGGSYNTLMESINKKILVFPDDTIIWPGHHYGRYPKSTVREQKGYYN